MDVNIAKTIEIGQCTRFLNANYYLIRKRLHYVWVGTTVFGRRVSEKNIVKKKTIL